MRPDGSSTRWRRSSRVRPFIPGSPMGSWCQPSIRSVRPPGAGILRRLRTHSEQAAQRREGVMATRRGNGSPDEASEGAAVDVGDLSYSDAGAELDAIIEEFETGV